MTKGKPAQPTFYGLGIAPGLLKRLDELSFVTPTPIQQKAIPIAVTGEDVIGIAQTGTGKTFAFSIPMIQQISATKRRGLVLLPTRELAIQVQDELEKLAGKLGLKTTLLIGGASMEKQIRSLKKGVHIIIATPGRLNDLLQQKKVSLKDTGILVLDEADRMLDMGFEPQIKRVLRHLPQQRQTMLFSATMPARIAQLAREYMNKPLRVEVAPAGTTSKDIDQEMIIVPRTEKIDLLKKLLDEYKGTVLIFSRTKHGAKKIARLVRKFGHTSAEIHSNRSLNQRIKALEGFKKGSYRILVATDIAARGIDVNEIELVINYDLPDNLDDYVHRIGRTGRGGAEGKAISFVAPEQRRDVQAIERLIKSKLPVTNLAGDQPTHKKQGKSRKKPNTHKRSRSKPSRSRSRKRSTNSRRSRSKNAQFARKKKRRITF